MERINDVEILERMKEDWADMIYNRLVREAGRKAVDWNRYVGDFIYQCRRDGGVPMFKTKYAGKRFEIGSKPAVLGICYGGRGMAKDSQWFKNIPEHELELVERETGEWRELAIRHLPWEKAEELAMMNLSEPIIRKEVHAIMMGDRLLERMLGEKLTGHFPRD
ncbi:MAG TPA: hypothetical protein ENG74_00810 [Thermoplasmatales archaeon]|nr:hypothetical protein [Thermoplasmatales archaeon]